MSKPQPISSILKIKPYVAGKSSDDAGSSPIKLSSNENSYGASPKAIEAYTQAKSNLNRYPDGGSSIVREAIAEVQGLPVGNIICGAGSDELIGLIVAAFAGEGDEVLFTEHGFLMYKIYTLAAGATPVEAIETNLTTDVDSLLAAVTERTKIVFFANPNNPTGSYISGVEVQRLRDGLPDHVILAIDGAYAEYAESMTDDYDTGAKIALSTDNTIMLRTFSKIYGLPALRLGWLVAGDYLCDIINRVRSPFNVATPSQIAGAVAMHDVEWTQEQCRLNLENMTYLKTELESLAMKCYPSVANFLLVDFDDENKATATLKALAKQNIFVRDVASYKLPTCLRITIGTKAECESLVSALQGL